MEQPKLEHFKSKLNSSYTRTLRAEYNSMKHESRSGKINFLSAGEEALASILAMRPPNREKELLRFLVSNALNNDSPRHDGMSRAVGF